MICAKAGCVHETSQNHETQSETSDRDIQDCILLNAAATKKKKSPSKESEAKDDVLGRLLCSRHHLKKILAPNSFSDDIIRVQ